MSDLISRQGAINAADSTDYTGLAIEDVKKVTDEVIKALKRLPSVQPRKGKWAFTTDGRLVCSCCYEIPTNRITINGDLIYDMTPIREHMKFCPNCGADLRGNENANE